jgi:DNA-binding CsgD family transcriptional regulator
VPALSPRQREILTLLAEDVPPKCIAPRLRLSPLTVRCHIRAACLKLGARTSIRAVTLAILYGEITPHYSDCA